MVFVSKFEPKKFLMFSKNLLKIKNPDPIEAFHRSAISRAYYSAFLFTREKINIIESRALDRTKPDMHRQVAMASQLINETLTDDLLELRDFRVDADYNFSNAECRRDKTFEMDKNPNDKGTVEHCIGLADSIIERVE